MQKSNRHFTKIWIEKGKYLRYDEVVMKYMYSHVFSYFYTFIDNLDMLNPNMRFTKLLFDSLLVKISKIYTLIIWNWFFHVNARDNLHVQDITILQEILSKSNYHMHIPWISKLSYVSNVLIMIEKWSSSSSNFYCRYELSITLLYRT